MQHLFDELRRRQVFRVAAAYSVIAWLVVQAASIAFPAFGAPGWVMRVLIALVVFGLPIALILAWAFELTPAGVQRAEPSRERLLDPLAPRAAAWMGLGILVGLVALGFYGWQRPVPAPLTPEIGEAGVEQGSIAVLPFVNLSSDPEQEYFSDGLTEELLNVLAQLPELKVASRTSAFAFKGKDVGIDSIARALNVTHVLEGSVRKADGRIRISAKLIEAATGYHLWSQSYDRDLLNVFAIQDEISRAILHQLQLRLPGGAAAVLAKQETLDPEAHALVLRGMAAARDHSEASGARAEQLFREAIARDPDYARAHALLAERLMWRAYWRQTPREGYELARASADRALALDPALSEAHVVRGRIADLHEWDFPLADHHLRQALTASPGNSVARQARAWLLMRLGQRDEAIEEARRATELDPLSAPARNTLGLTYLYSGQPGAAADAFQVAIAIAPEYPAAVGNLAMSYSFLGRHDEAIRAAERHRQLNPQGGWALTTSGRVYARAGRTAEAEEILAGLLAEPGVPPYRLATLYAALGDRARTLDMLERAVAERDDNASWLAVTPEFDALREDARFERLLRSGGLR